MYKKISQLMMAMLLVSVFAACNNEGDKAEAADTTVTPAPMVEPPADTTKNDTIIDTTGVQKPVIKTN